MYQTIQVSSCVSVQGDLVEHLPNGDAVVSDGRNVYRGRPIAAIARAPPIAPLRPIARPATRPEAARQSQPASSRSRIATIIVDVRRRGVQARDVGEGLAARGLESVPDLPLDLLQRLDAVG